MPSSPRPTRPHPSRSRPRGREAVARGSFTRCRRGGAGSLVLHFPMSTTEPVAAILLAGGRSSRMGGGDKCLRMLGGKTILARIVERLEPQVAAMVVSANGDPSRFAPFGLAVV